MTTRIEQFQFESHDGTTIRGESKGAGPPVVLSHGWMGNRSTWDSVTEILARHNQVVTYDQRGHGRSGSGSIEPSIDVLAKDLALVIETVGVTTPVIAGHSLGGMVAMKLAAQSPDQMSGLVLISTSARPSQRWRPGESLLGPLLGSRFGTWLTQGRSGWLMARSAFGFGVAAETVDHTRRTIDATEPSSRRRQFAEIINLDLRPHLSKISTPTKVMVGRLDSLLPLGHAKLLHSHIEASTLDILGRAGHMLPLERPQEVAQAIATTIIGSPVDRSAVDRSAVDRSPVDRSPVDNFGRETAAGEILDGEGPAVILGR